MIESDGWLGESFCSSQYRGSHVLVIGPDNEARRTLVSAVMRLGGTPDVCRTSLLTGNVDAFLGLSPALRRFELGVGRPDSFPLMGLEDGDYLSRKSDRVVSILSMLSGGFDASDASPSDRKVIEAIGRMLAACGNAVFDSSLPELFKCCVRGNVPVSSSMQVWAGLAGGPTPEMDGLSIAVGYEPDAYLAMPEIVALLLMTLIARRVRRRGDVYSATSVVVADGISSEAWRLFRKLSGLARARLFGVSVCLATDEFPGRYADEEWGGFWKVIAVPDAAFWESDRGIAAAEGLGLGNGRHEVLCSPESAEPGRGFYVVKRERGPCEIVRLPGVLMSS